MIAHRFLSKKGKGANIPNEVIDAAINRHSDGFGIAWRDPDKGLLYAKFGPTERREFRDALKAIDADKRIEYVAHFRYATHGPEDRAHAHPYAYEDPDPEVGTVLVFHNGIISSMTTTKEESDTEVFVRDFIAKLPSRWWTNAGCRKFVDHVGGWSRLVLMTAKETVNLNWADGEEDQGLWYSSEHRPPKYGTYNTTYQSTYISENWDDEDDDDWVKIGDGTESGWLRRREAREFGLLGEATGVAKISTGITTTPIRNDGVWMSEGHLVEPLQTFDFTVNGDYPNSVVCGTCGTCGDVYIVNKKAYVDIMHSWSPAIVKEEDDSCDEDILPGEPKKTFVEAVAEIEKRNRALTVVTGASGQNYARVN